MDSLRWAIKQRGLRNLTGFRIPSSLNIEKPASQTVTPLILKDCRIEGDLSIAEHPVAGNLGSIKCTGSLTLKKIDFDGDVSFENAEIGENLQVNGTAGLLRMHDCKCGGDALFSGNFGDELTIRQSRFRGAFEASDVVTGHLQITRSDFEKQLILANVNANVVTAEREVRVEKNFHINLTPEKTDRPRYVYLRSVYVRGDSEIESRRGVLHLSVFRTRQGGDLIFTPDPSGASSLDLRRSLVGGDLYVQMGQISALTIRGTVIQGETEVSNKKIHTINVHGSQLSGGLSFKHSQVRGDAFFDCSIIATFADFSFATFGRNVSMADTTFMPLDDKASRVLFLSTDFQHRADFAGTRFYLPTLFRFLDLDKVRFDNVWLGLCSFVKCRVAGLQLSNISWLSARERLAYVGYRAMGWLRRSLAFNSRYDVLLDDLLCRYKRRPDLFKDYDFRAAIAEHMEPVHIARLAPGKAEGGKWTLEKKRETISDIAPASVSLEQSAELLRHLESRHGPDAIKTREVVSLYQQLKNNYETNGNPVEAGEFFFAEMELKRFDESLQIDGRPKVGRGFFLKNLYRILNGYGERPVRPMAYFLMLCVVCTLAYLYTGLEVGENRAVSSGHSRYEKLEWKYRKAKYEPALCNPAGPVCRGFFEIEDLGAAALYSIKHLLPFIQRAEPSVLPAGFATRVVSMLEQFIGAVLIASFLVALRRRYKR